MEISLLIFTMHQFSQFISYAIIVIRNLNQSFSSFHQFLELKPSWSNWFC